MISRKSQQAIDSEADAWAVRLQDAHTQADRDAFEDWLAERPENRPAYDRAVAAYQLGGVLRTSEIARRRDLEAVFSRRAHGRGHGLVAASIALLLVVGGYQLSRGVGLFQPAPVLESVMLASGEVPRSVTLVDGSKVRMAPLSQLRIDFTREQRLAEIRKGRVRVTIAAEKRPFRIVAADRITQARSGVFDAEVAAGHGLISSAPADNRASRQTSESQVGDPANRGSFRQTVELEAEPLGRAIERINQLHAGPRLEIDPALRDLRVTAVFQRGDSRAMGRSLALAFGLRLSDTPSGNLLLSPAK